MKRSTKIIYLIIGPVLFFLCLFLLPGDFTAEARGAIGMVAWMAFWWITGPVDYAVTALLPIAVNALFQMADMGDVIKNYASETIILLLGASLITASWEETGLDQRIAAKFLSLIGGNLRVQLIFWYILTVVLSAILPNAVVCAAITPIAVSMLKHVGEGDIANSKIGSLVLLTIVYGTGVGGLASPLGGAMNLTIVDTLEKFTGQEYMYASWVVRFLPIMVVLVISNLIYLILCCKKTDTLGGSREYFLQQYKEMPSITRGEVLSLVLFLIATAAAFCREFYKDLLPGLKPAYIFIICAILSFLITKKGGTRLMSWKSAEKKVTWDLIYIFAGGLALGTLVEKSGAAQTIGDLVAGMDLSGNFVTVLIIVTLTVLMSDVTSNTATAAVAMPIVVSVVSGINKDLVIPFIYIAAIGVNLSYMLPTSIRAIPVGYGLQPKYMLKKGAPLTVIVILLMSVTGYLLMKFWPAFSTI